MVFLLLSPCGPLFTWCKMERIQLEGCRRPSPFEQLEQYCGICALKSYWTDKAFAKDVQFWLPIKRQGSFFVCSCLVWKTYFMPSKTSAWIRPAGEASGVQNKTSVLCQVWGCDKVQSQQTGFLQAARSCWACHARLSICIPSAWSCKYEFLQQRNGFTVSPFFENLVITRF